MTQDVLLRIVQTWNLSEKPEYRGFRCANCQNYMHKAWYHWLTEGGYRTPVHFCNDCESDYNSSNIVVVKQAIGVERDEFGLEFDTKLEKLFRQIQSEWDTDADPIYKAFTCDKCNSNMRKAWHVWINMDGLLVEEHFCRPCGCELELDKL